MPSDRILLQPERLHQGRSRMVTYTSPELRVSIGELHRCWLVRAWFQ